MKIYKLIALGLFISITAAAQTGRETGTKYGTGEDSLECLKNLSLYSEDLRNKNYDAAYPAWEAAFNNCPAATVNLYIDGATLLEHKIKKNKDAATFEDLYQKLMKVYDQRMEFFGDNRRTPTPEIKGFKALDMLKYKRNDAEVLAQAYALLDESVNYSKEKSQLAFLATFMTTSVNMYKMGKIDAMKLVEDYTLVTDGLDNQLKNPARAKYHGQIEKVKGSVETLFANSGAANCETIDQIFAPQLEDKKFDLAWLKMVSRLLVRGLCDDSELLYKVSEYQHNIEPSSASAYGLAKMYLKSNDMNRAIDYFKEAIDLCEDNDQKGEFLQQLGLVYLTQEKYSAARASALRAIELRPNWGAPYIVIGKAYAISANTIGTKELEKKSAYWAAVDKFMKAKSVDPSVAKEADELIRTYSVHFPATDEIFFEGYKNGETYTVGGWINEKTTIRAK
ncbi:tetratricopeptide repeat protein [Geofilum sp. OHC36d9]|uniref:tetratricopeptide repeat protein n=1 Tax=Geofilum sp. OHC36d9 TaxID=3458413 RepID=UPI0040338C79